MNKFILILLFALSFYTIKGEIYGTCDDSTLSTSEIDEDYCSLLRVSAPYTHCCYMESDKYSECIALSDDQYENIVRFKKYLRDHKDDDDIGIDCSSKYISLSLLAIFALLF